MSTHQRAKRQEIKGWSSGAVRRNLKFLYSIDERGLTGEGWAFTLTVRRCPPTHEDWHRAIENYLYKLQRLLGTIRVHWVTEWQRRGVPHLHGAIWFPDEVAQVWNLQNVIQQVWLPYGAPFGAGPQGQMAKPIDGVLGWFQYVSKHAARGVRHYQRASENIPQGWQKTGRMWGKGGDWPTREPVKLEVDNRGYHVLRRWVRGWRVADARYAHVKACHTVARRDDRRALKGVVDARRRILSARHALRCSDPLLSAVRGVSEWIGEDLLLRMIERLALDGYPVDSV